MSAPDKKELAKLSNKELIKLGASLGLKLSDKAAKKQLIGSVFDAQQKKFLEGAAGPDVAKDAADPALNAPIAGAEEGESEGQESGAGAETSSPAGEGETLPGWMLPFASRIGSLESRLSSTQSQLDSANKRIAALEAIAQKAGVKLDTDTTLHGKVSGLRRK